MRFCEVPGSVLSLVAGHVCMCFGNLTSYIVAVILLDWILIGALDGARLALEVDPLILFVDWSGFKTVELLELQTLYLIRTDEY